MISDRKRSLEWGKSASYFSMLKNDFPVGYEEMKRFATLEEYNNATANLRHALGEMYLSLTTKRKFTMFWKMALRDRYKTLKHSYTFISKHAFSTAEWVRPRTYLMLRDILKRYEKWEGRKK